MKLSEKKKRKLKRKILKAPVFVVLSTKNFVEALKNPESDVVYHAEVCKQYNKPVILLIDKALSDEEIIYIERYFSSHNIRKELSYDITNATEEQLNVIASQILQVSRDVEIEEELRYIRSKNVFVL